MQRYREVKAIFEQCKIIVGYVCFASFVTLRKLVHQIQR